MAVVGGACLLAWLGALLLGGLGCGWVVGWLLAVGGWWWWMCGEDR